MPTWTSTAKPTSVFTNTSKPNNTWLDNIEYLVSQALDFLMTQDGKYLITNQSNVFSNPTKPTNSWNNLSI